LIGTCIFKSPLLQKILSLKKGGGYACLIRIVKIVKGHANEPFVRMFVISVKEFFGGSLKFLWKIEGFNNNFDA